GTLSEKEQAECLRVSYFGVYWVGLSQKKLKGITLTNLCASDDIVIDKIKVSWNNAASNERIVRVRIDGSVVWSGNKRSGATLDISDVTISAGAVDIPINFMKFSKDLVLLVGRTFEIVFIMSDGSSQTVTFSVSVSPL
ncbi:hypothetical protein KAW55_00370, partial [bacterium]|nr:hypothetical protein [bacterium]